MFGSGRKKYIFGTENALAYPLFCLRWGYSSYAHTVRLPWMVKRDQRYRRPTSLSRINPLSRVFFASSSVSEDVVSSFSGHRHPAALTLPENTLIHFDLDRLFSHPAGFHLVRPMFFFCLHRNTDFLYDDPHAKHTFILYVRWKNV